MRRRTQKLLTAKGAKKSREDRKEDRKEKVTAYSSSHGWRHSRLWCCWLVLFLLAACSAGILAQSSPGSQSGSAPSTAPAGNSQKPDTSFPTPKPAKPDLSPPRSDRVNANDLGSELGQSSSKDTQTDLSAPENDVRTHPQSAEAVAAELAAAGGGSTVGEFHPWNPHRAAKDVEVGDYYFKRKNYKGAEDRYREALFYKENDAEATFHLAVCLQKMQRREEALAEYQSYLKILPEGPHAGEAHKEIERLNGEKAGK
jgi:tetratricopeptide (TPR) repeat protein